MKVHSSEHVVLQSGRLACVQQGFTMLEVLITILIVSFGLLALAGLFLNGLRMNNSSFLRSVATQQAYDLSDRMRANVSGVSAGNYNAISFPGSAQACADCDTVSCTASNLAAYDACSWNNDNISLLPMGRGTVTRSGNVFSITLSWDDNRSGSPNQNFVLRFEP